MIKENYYLLTEQLFQELTEHMDVLRMKTRNTEDLIHLQHGMIGRIKKRP